jgi:hypothetical protein
VNDDLETTYKKLEDYIFGREEKSEASPVGGNAVEEEKVMAVENGHTTPVVIETVAVNAAE